MPRLPFFPFFTFTVALTSLLTLAGCTEETCGVAGTTQACLCPTGAMGAQSCQADGTFSACMCAGPTVDAGTMRDAGSEVADAGSDPTDAGPVDGGPVDGGPVDAGPQPPFGAEIGIYYPTSERWVARTNLGGGAFASTDRFDLSGLVWERANLGRRPVVGDFDGDGTPDLGAVGRQFEFDRLATFEFRRSSGGANTVADRNCGDDESCHAGDFDGDGFDDRASFRPAGGGEDGRWFLYLNPADCTAGQLNCDFGQDATGLPFRFGRETRANAAFVCDFDGDGYDDIGLVNGADLSPPALQVKRNIGRMDFGSPDRFEAGLYIDDVFDVSEQTLWVQNRVFAEDFDADGLCDVGVYESATSRWIVRLNQGDGTLSDVNYVDLVFGGDEAGGIPFVADFGD